MIYRNAKLSLADCTNLESIYRILDCRWRLAVYTADCRRSAMATFSDDDTATTKQRATIEDKTIDTI
jgi:hypothetical protein